MMKGRIIPALIMASLLLLGFVTPAAADTPILPEIGSVSGVTGHGQTYGLSCESRSAADVAVFWGSTYGETDILNALPRSDDPEIGFVGDVDGAWGYIPPQAYGVHAQPIARALQGFGLDAEARQSMSWDEARAEIAAGRPLIVWLIGAVWSGTPEIYTTVQGRQVTVAAFEHTMTLIGYDPEHVTLINAGDGKTGVYSLQDFLTSWAVLNNMAVVVRGVRDPNLPTATAPQPATALPATPNPGAQPTGLPTFPPDPATVLPPFPGSTPEWGFQPSPTPAWMTYVVQAGDTLSSLAERFGTTMEAIAAANALPYPHVIYSGQIIQIPVGSPAGEPLPPPLVSETPVGEESTIEPAQRPDGIRNYTVQAGETLAKIARRFGTNWRSLAQINRLIYPYVVTPGQVLQVPALLPTQTP